MNGERSVNQSVNRLSTYAALAAVTTAVPATSQAAVVWSGDNGFTPVTVPLGATANISFPAFGSVFRFWNATVYSASTFNGPAYNSAVINRLIATASIIALGNDPVRFAYSQFSNPIDGGEGGFSGPFWMNADPSGTGNDLAGDSAGDWNGSDTQQGYLLFRFDPDGGQDSFRYGWFDVSYDNNTDDLTVNGWAFGDSPLGAGHLDNAEVPEASTLVPAGLFALAAGAAGLRRRRAAQRKAAVAA